MLVTCEVFVSIVTAVSIATKLEVVVVSDDSVLTAVAETVTVMVEVGAETVVVRWDVTPMHEQALEYCMAPEQGDAYAGIRDGRTVAWRPLNLTARKVSTDGIVVVVVVVVTVVDVLISVSETVPGTVVMSVTVTVVGEVGRVVTVRDAIVETVTLRVVDVDVVRL